LESERGAKKRGAGKTALVADDNAVIREMLVAAFLSDGFDRCGEAANGKEAVEVAKQIRPDVIILDFLMPVKNGLEAASALRRIFPNAPIILFTFYADSILEEVASSAGVSLVLMKSIAPSDLVDHAYELMRD
jgi:CheY-like chemotaxis protein